ncbi:MAG: hypothetical protein JKY43_05680 [Phycisphaerales bacterium]|nr:hypothetical protein [Phycisphaerales bacterium]
MKAKNALSLALAAGIASTAAASNTPTKVDPTDGQIKHVAHIYFNIVTGEKITTLIQDGVQSPAGVGASPAIWIADTGAQCADFGDTTAYYYGIDGMTTTTGGTVVYTTEEYFFDWGDIAMDTVVDSVQIHWVTNHQDTDTDLDSIGDGVEGFAGNWIYYDAMNGRGPEFQSINEPLIAIGLFNLPGEISDPNDEFVAVYTADIDLGASGTFGTSLIFEIADTDSDLQGAAVHNERMDLRFTGLLGVPDIDPDGDGLADWGWSLTYNQPGTVDVDNADGDSDPSTGIDGDILNFGTTGVIFGSPTPGHPEFDSIAGTWSWISDGPTAGVTEDVFNTGTLDSVTGSIVFDGPWWFGGLACTTGGGAPGSGYVPAAHFQTVLYGPGGVVPCPADLNGDGTLDFFDISFFLANSVDYNGDTVFDFFDISAFLAEYGAGCPTP